MALSLGARSIIADPRSPKMQKQRLKSNTKVSSFLPSVLNAETSEWFEHEKDSPYMLLVASVKEDKRRMMTEEERHYLVLIS